MTILPSVNAQVVAFPNGSFEDNNGITATDWNFFYLTPSFASGSCVTGTYQFTTDHPTDGFYSLYFPNQTNRCINFVNTLKTFQAGNYNFYLDYNINGAGVGPSLRIYRWNGAPDANATALCTITSGNQQGTATCNANTSFDFNVGIHFQAVGNVGEGWFDNFRYEQIPTMEMNVVEEGDPFPIDTNFSLTNEIFLDTNAMEVTGATCTATWGGTNNSMPYNTSIGKYELTKSQSIPGVVNYVVGCTSDGYTADQNISGSVTFTVSLTGKLIVTDIENVTHTLNSTNVDFFPTNESNQIIYSIENDYTSSLNIPQTIFNSLTDGRQYWIYTATPSQYDAGIWVFDDSLTFGPSVSEVLQKIWNGSDRQYEYSFSDTLLPGEKKFYQLKYLAPYKHYFSIKDSLDWVNQYNPGLIDNNGIPANLFPISSFSNIRSYYIENIPDISGDETAAYEFQFTAWSDVSGTTIQAGQTIAQVDGVQSIALTSSPHRYSFSINSNGQNAQILLKTANTSFANVYITDYAIVPKGYFTKKLELFKLNGDVLDLFLVNNQSKKYLQEGKEFKISTEAYDFDGKLQTLEIKGYFNSTGADINQVSHEIDQLDTADEKTFTFNNDMNGIVDLNGNAQNPLIPRDFIIKAVLKDEDGVEIALQSEVVKFVQYPYFPEDMTILFFPTEKKKGKNPAGILTVNVTAPETLLGYDIRIWDVNTSTTINSPLYQSSLYKGIDFDCIGNNCGIQLKINDFIFQDTGQTYIAVTAIMNTEYFSLTNPVVQSLRSIYVTSVDFDIAKIHQLNERVDRTYKSTEEIPLVLILRDTDATDISDKINVYMTIANCADSTPNNGPCVEQTTKFKYTGFQYDSKNNANYFFFRHLWYLDSGNLLPDGNHIAFRAHVSDSKGVTTPIVPVLADKCATNGTDFWSNAISSILNGVGCSVDQNAIVSLGNTQERALLIDSSHVTTAPSQELFACINTDTNNVIDKPLEANLYCFVWYQVAEKPIDDFRLRITNQYSKVSDTGTTKQYVEFQIPYELIAMNDLPLLKQELETNQQTTITSIQDFIQAGLQGIVVGGLNNLGIEGIVDGSNLITNIGADLNLNQAFSPTTVGGFAWLRIKGIPVINAQDFKSNPEVSEDFENIDRTQFLNYLAEKGVSYPSKQAEMDIIINSFTVPQKIVDLNGHLVIDEEGSTTPINTQNADINSAQPYKFIPSILYFTLQNTMFYENHTGNDTRTLVIKITTLISENFFNGLTELVQDFIQDPVNTIIDFLFDNLGVIIILILLLFGSSVIYLNYRRANRGG